MIPAGAVLRRHAVLVETFVIDHQNAESWRSQKDGLLAAANATAYQTGYDAALGSYQDLSNRHIAELGKPRVKLGSALGLVVAGGTGVLIGSVVR